MKPLLRHHSSLLILSVILFFSITLSPSTSAQNLTRSGAHALDDWHSVQSLAAQTRIRLTTDKKKTACFIDSVTDDHLTCSSSSAQGSTETEYSKSEIKEIKLTNRSHSTVAGTFLGLGVGAGVGAAVGVMINSGIAYHTTHAKAAGAGAAVGATAGVIAGAALGYAKDWFAGPVVYRRP